MTKRNDMTKRGDAKRQRRWRSQHPEQAAAHLEALTAKKAQEKREKKPATACHHEHRVPVLLVYCGECRGVRWFLPEDRDKAHADWMSLSRAPTLGDEE